MLCKIFAVVCCAAEMSARNRKINIYFAPSRLGKKSIYLFLFNGCESKKSRSAAHAESKPSFVRGDLATIALASPLVLALI